MSVHLTCPRCRQRMALARKSAATVRCSGCRTLLTVAVAQADPVVSWRAVLAASVVALLGVVGMTVAAAAWVERRPVARAEAAPASADVDTVAPLTLVRTPTAPVIAPVAETPALVVEVAKPAPVAAPVVLVPRPAKRSEEDLRQELLRVPVFRLKAAPFGKSPEMTELAGLPFVRPGQGRLERQAAEDLVIAASQLRELLRNPHAKAGTPMEISDWLSPQLARLPEAAVPAMQQILCIESDGVRQAMIHRLIHVTHPAAGEALVRLAVFDVAENIRNQAIAALALRQPEEYRAALLAALRHPWPPAAEHAAWALASLEDHGAVPELKKLLDEPNPTAPFAEGDSIVVRELVRVNHLASCLMCHPKAASIGDPVAGRIPDPSEPLPPRAYYDDPKGIFVRADSTFLRQDFSMIQPVEAAHPWPAQQRFDFVVRTRPATAKERAAAPPANYPQRQAVRYALQELARPPRVPGS